MNFVINHAPCAGLIACHADLLTCSLVCYGCSFIMISKWLLLLKCNIPPFLTFTKKNNFTYPTWSFLFGSCTGWSVSCSRFRSLIVVSIQDRGIFIRIIVILREVTTDRFVKQRQEERAGEVVVTIDCGERSKQRVQHGGAASKREQLFFQGVQLGEDFFDVGHFFWYLG